MKLDVKICGLKTKAAVEAAVENGASHVGFIFFPPSPRHVTPQVAQELRKFASGRAKAVAVTVDAGDAELDGIVMRLSPDMLQLHGKESPARVATLRSRYGLPVMKALPIREAADLAAIADYRPVADRLLFDAKPPQGAVLPGGLGRTFDWKLLADLDPEVDYMLSGGLQAGNIAQALSILTPRGIDISSGVEVAPGEKSPQLIVQFFAALAEAVSRLEADNKDMQG